jgi:hypothetical protein
MATTTPNFGWTVPTSTDLVKDGATAIETLGDGIDASFVGLKGGTTGQVLSKTSGTDLAFTWVAQDDSNAIQNAIVDAKGDLIGATAADTPSRLAVGTNGQVLTADSTAATGLKWATSTSGGMTLLSTITLSGSSTTYSSITTGYKYLKLIGVNVQNNTTARDIDIQVNGASTGVYLAGVVVGTANAKSNTTIPISAGAGVKNATNVTFTCDIYNYDSSTVEKVIHLDGLMTADYLTTIQAYNYGGVFKSTTAITSLVILSSSGTLSGTIYAYGVN